MRAVVIGAGISGLSAALALHRAGVEVCVLERAAQAGGVIQTLREQGYQLEAGANSYTSTGPAINALVHSLGLTPLAVDRAVARKRYLLHRGSLCGLPDNPLALLTTPLLSAGGKARVLQEPWRSPVAGADPSLADFIRHRLGAEVLARLVEPFVSGVYAGDPEALSARAVFPRLSEWERDGGSLLRGALKARKAAKPRTPYRLLSFSTGMAALPQAMAQALPADCLRPGVDVAQVQAQPTGGYRMTLHNGDSLDASAVILATPADVTARLLAAWPEAAREALNQIPYAAMNVCHTGFDRAAIPHPLDGFGFLAPRAEGLPLLGSIWASALFAGRAPQGKVLFSSFIGGAQHPEIQGWPDAQVGRTVIDNLARVLKAPGLEPEFTRLIRWPRAIPQYTLGHGERVRQVEEALPGFPGLQLCGNYLSGVSLNDCVASGERAAAAVAAYLNGGRRA